MRILVTGGDGLLATALLPRLRVHHEVAAVDVGDGDIGDRAFVRDRVRSARPDVIVHLAAMTAVEKAELRQKLRPRGFMLVLIGKDGGVKLRKPFPWDVREISRLRGRLSMLPQDAAFQGGIPIIDQLVMFARLNGFTPDEADEKASVRRKSRE